MVAAFAKGDVETARQINARLLPSFAFESTDDAPNPLPAKAVLRLLGQPGGGCRPPMDGEPPSLEGRARAVLAGLGIDLPDA
jgi:4-hydroxy-tetrahydrodipicolinate synthase